MDEPIDPATLAERTTEIVAAFVAHNKIQPTEISGLIGLVAGRLASLGAAAAEAVPAKPEPAVPVRRSISPDQITCLTCGKKQKLLKRHLAVAHGLAPAQYREQFGLKPDYPMVAPNYAQARSELALRIGLGRPKPKARPGKRAAPERTATEQTPAKRPQAKPAAAKRAKGVPAAAE